jgi:glycerophosphoryl diester phosphodiesterase
MTRHLHPISPAAANESQQSRHCILVTAHRGFSGRAPENTLAAFRAAIAAGCDMIELDVHLSRDKRLVVIHDDTLKRTTDGRGEVADRSLRELRQLDAGAWFASGFAGERIPTLEEVLALARSRIGLNIELKNGPALPYTMEALADRAWDEVSRLGMRDQVLFSSFAPAAIDRILAHDAAQPVALITSRPWRTPEEASPDRRYPRLNCLFRRLDAGNVALAHAAGIRVQAWTVNTRPAMQRLIALGIDGIISNHPDRLVRILAQQATDGKPFPLDGRRRVEFD